MDFQYSPEQLQLINEVARFAKKESAALARDYEDKSIFPRGLHKKIGQKGWTGPIVPKAYGGMGKGALEYCIIMEELSKELITGPQTSVQLEKMLLSFGTERQKRLYLPKLASGEYVAALAISEPQAGSSFKNLQTTAKKDNTFYIINGKKSHINLAGDADVLMVFTRTDIGLTCLLIDRDTPGVRFEKRDPLGMRTLPVYDIFLEGCRVPGDHLLGEEGKGLSVFLTTFNLSRIGNASTLIGFARGCLEHAVSYARDRRVGDSRVVDFQGIQWLLAEMVAELEAARLIRDRAALAEDAGIEHTLDTSISKLLAAEVAEKIVSRAFSLTGSYACYRESPFDRYWREIKTLQVAGGSSEIMKNTIAREILLSYKF